MPDYRGQTPLGNLATTNLYQAYQDYVINQQESGVPAATYDQWFQATQGQPLQPQMQQQPMQPQNPFDQTQ